MKGVSWALGRAYRRPFRFFFAWSQQADFQLFVGVDASTRAGPFATERNFERSQIAVGEDHDLWFELVDVALFLIENDASPFDHNLRLEPFRKFPLTQCL